MDKNILCLSLYGRYFGQFVDQPASLHCVNDLKTMIRVRIYRETMKETK